MHDELQEFSAPYDITALVHGMLSWLIFTGVAVFGSVVAYRLSKHHLVDHVALAAWVTLVFFGLAHLLGYLRALVSRRPALRLADSGLTRFHPIWGTTSYDWGQVGGFLSRNKLDTRNNRFSVVLDLHGREPDRKRLFTIDPEQLTINAPDLVKQTERFVERHRAAHPETQTRTATRINKNAAGFSVFLFAVFVATFVMQHFFF